jgi:ABC-type bacteriocin/lantibiotic exporter with double-glycine peptidase domain
MGETIINQLQQYQKKMLRTFRISRLVTMLIGVCRGLISNIPTMIVLGYGGSLVMRGEISIGSLIAFYQVVGRIYAPINNVMQIVMSSIGAKVPLSRIETILDDVTCISPPDRNLQLESDGVNTIAKNAVIHFNNVTFSYKREFPVLKEINFHIPPKMTTLIIGPSGSGKTTIARLLTNTIQPDKGSILIGKNKLSMLSDQVLYRQIVMVEQNPVFFSCSIMENLLFASSSATKQQVQKALWVADIEDFIEQLPDGLNTKLNDRGINISGGEMRRLALARAILTSPRILILDETTSSVEPFVERRISQRIRKLNSELTLVVITHRMTLVEEVDKLIFVEEGRVTGMGSHQHLYANCPSYKELYFEEGPEK